MILAQERMDFAGVSSMELRGVAAFSGKFELDSANGGSAYATGLTYRSDGQPEMVTFEYSFTTALQTLHLSGERDLDCVIPGTKPPIENVFPCDEAALVEAGVMPDPRLSSRCLEGWGLAPWYTIGGRLRVTLVDTTVAPHRQLNTWGGFEIDVGAESFDPSTIASYGVPLDVARALFDALGLTQA